MTAVYNRLPVRDVRRVRLGRWVWLVTDGIGGPILAAGHARTRGAAEVDSSLAQADCKPSLLVRVERAADRLRRECLPVRVRVDELGRVCVRPVCACTTRDEVRVLAAFLAITGAVRWEVA